MTNEAKREIAHLIDEKTLEDIYFIINKYPPMNEGYEKIFEIIEKTMSDYHIVKEGKVGILVVVAMHSETFEKFKNKVLL